MELKLDARMRRLLRRIPVVNVYSVVEIALLAGLAIQSARLVWALVTPVAPLGDWRPAAPVIPASPGDQIAGFDPFFRLQQQQQGPAVVTALQLTLFGTRSDEATGRGAAILAGPDGVQRSVSVGEEVQPGVTLAAVFFDHITVDRGGAKEDLFLDQSGNPAAPGAPGGAPPGTTGGGVQAVTVDSLRQEIGFIPRLDNGGISGLVVRSQGTGAAFRAAGLRDGDVVVQLGGRPVRGPADLDRIATELRGGGNLSIQVERGRELVPLSVTIAPTP